MNFEHPGQFDHTHANPVEHTAQTPAILVESDELMQHISDEVQDRLARRGFYSVADVRTYLDQYPNDAKSMAVDYQMTLTEAEALVAFVQKHKENPTEH